MEDAAFDPVRSGPLLYPHPRPRSHKFEMPGIARQNRPPIRSKVPDLAGEKGLHLNQQTLSMRLARVAAHVPAGARLADIGSDHGYLPVALLLRGSISAAVAGEVALTPFHAARRTVRDNSLERLILQPNGGEQPLRQWLMDNGYRILCEEVLRENRFDYEIIVAERTGPVSYSPRELYFGPLQLQARSPAFLAKWQRLLRLKQRTLENFSRAQAVPEEKVQDMARQVRWISELLG